MPKATWQRMRKERKNQKKKKKKNKQKNQQSQHIAITPRTRDFSTFQHTVSIAQQGRNVAYSADTAVTAVTIASPSGVFPFCPTAALRPDCKEAYANKSSFVANLFKCRWMIPWNLKSLCRWTIP
jgi:hypothetical protein